MTTTLLVGARLEEDRVAVADTLLKRLEFDRADPVLDRHGLNVANAIDPGSVWWVWDPSSDDAPYGLASAFDEGWKLALDELLALAREQRIYIAIAHLGDITAVLRFGARDRRMLSELIQSLFSSTTIPADSCVIEYGPEANVEAGNRMT
jgi:hypothetical protein